MATSVNMTATAQNEKKIQRSITHINPTATDADLLAFVEGVNSLSTNTLEDARRIDTKSLMNDTKLPRNLRFINDSDQPITEIPLASVGSDIENTYGIILKADGLTYETPVFVQPIMKNLTGQTRTLLVEMNYLENDGFTYYMFIYGNSQDELGVSALTFYLPETDNYQAATATLQFV